MYQYGDHQGDIYILKDNDVIWTENWGNPDQAGSYENALASGKNIVLKQATPGQTWNNTYTTSLWSNSGDNHTEKVSFIGFEDMNFLGKNRRAAHINISGTKIYYYGTKSGSKTDYNIDYWLVKGIGIIKSNEKETSYYNNKSWTRFETDQLVAIN